MNYDNFNKIHDYWRYNILPYLSHKQTVYSFDEYLKKFSFLPSGRWLREYEVVKLSRTSFPVNPELFVKRYKDVCVTYNTPIKPEDGFQRVIYQISPTLHCEGSFWIWVENEQTFAYALTFSCYHDETEYLSFLDDLSKMRQEGNTESMKKPAGFAGMTSLAELSS